MKDAPLPADCASTEETVRALQAELAETNQGLIALTLELEQRVDARTAELKTAYDELQRTNAELMQLTMELEDRVTQRTEEIRKLNEELEQRVAARTRELTVSNEELEAFTYSVSHDLRGPLRHLHGFSRILLDDFSNEVSPPARRCLERIQEAARQMGEMVDNLLALSRIGRQGMHLQDALLEEVVQQVIRDLQPESKGRQIDWRIGRLPCVVCDPGLMKLVFANLLANALKFTRPRNLAVIEVNHAAANSEPVIIVRDNGVGFDMKYADKLFGVFQRLHRQEDFEGTGIGLATVQRIIHKHGGRIWAEAELDKGAAFYFTFGDPRRQAEPSTGIRQGATC